MQKFNDSKRVAECQEIRHHHPLRGVVDTGYELRLAPRPDSRAPDFAPVPVLIHAQMPVPLALCQLSGDIRRSPHAFQLMIRDRSSENFGYLLRHGASIPDARENEGKHDRLTARNEEFGSRFRDEQNARCKVFALAGFRWKRYLPCIGRQ
jgi:hypothetical protein